MKMRIYDYASREHFIDLPDKEIKSIFVLVLSGDETGEVEFVDGTSVDFDAANDRMMGYNDGYYLVEGEDIQKWLNWKASEDSITAAYNRQRAFSDDFLMDKCGTCKHYIGSGDWNLCCSIQHPTPKEKETGMTFTFGHLCYEDTDACDMYETKGKRQC